MKKGIVTIAIVLCAGCASLQRHNTLQSDAVFSAPRQQVLEQLDAQSVLLVVRWQNEGYSRQIIEDPNGLREVRAWLEDNLPEVLPSENEVGAVMAHWWLLVAERKMSHAEQTALISLYGRLGRSGSETLLTEEQLASFAVLLERWAKPYQLPVTEGQQNNAMDGD